MTINRTRALHTTQLLLVAVGGTSMAVCAAAFQWWIALAGLAWTGITWTAVYKFLERWERANVGAPTK